MSNNITKLREHLFSALEGLKSGDMDIEKAKAMSEVSQTIINSAKVEVEYAKATGSKGSGFLDEPQQLPHGITGVTVHRLAR